MTTTARDIMRKNVISVPTTMDLRDLAKLFLARGITGAPVTDESGNLAGVVSQTDLVYYNLTRDDQLVMDSHFYQSARVEGGHIPRGFQIEDTNTGCVADVMTPVVHSVTERASVESVARLMTRKHIHRVIVRNGRKVSGIISALDVLRSTTGKTNGSTKSGTAKSAAARPKRKRTTAAKRDTKRATATRKAKPARKRGGRAAAGRSR